MGAGRTIAAVVIIGFFGYLLLTGSFGNFFPGQNITISPTNCGSLNDILLYGNFQGVSLGSHIGGINFTQASKNYYIGTLPSPYIFGEIWNYYICVSPNQTLTASVSSINLFGTTRCAAGTVVVGSNTFQEFNPQVNCPLLSNNH